MPSPTAFDGLTVNGSSDYIVLLQRSDQSAPYENTVTERTRPNQSPVIDQRSYGARHIPFTVILKTGASITIPQFITNVRRYFTPLAGARTLTATLDDGTTSALLTVDILHCDRTGLGVFEGEFEAADPLWRATSNSTDSASPLTVAGNAKALPTITITPNTTTLRRRRVTVTDGGTRGLANYLVRVTFDSTGVSATATSNYIVFYQGRSVPFLVQTMNNAATTLDVRVDVPPAGSSVFDIYYGSSVVNTLTNNQLDDGGMNLASASFSNTNWVWDDFAIPALIAATGSWRPVKMGQVISGVSWGLVSYDGTSIKFGLRPSTAPALNNDFDGMALVVGSQAGVTNALAGLSRDDTTRSSGAIAGVYNIQVAYRTAGSLSWVIADTFNGGAARTTAVDLDNAVEIAVYLEPGSTLANVDMELKASGTFQLALVATPTVSAAAAVTARIITGSLTNTTTGKAISFPSTYTDDVAVAVDCLNKSITPASGPLYNPPLPADVDDWFYLAIGSNAWTDPTNAAASFSWPERYVA